MSVSIDRVSEIRKILAPQFGDMLKCGGTCPDMKIKRPITPKKTLATSVLAGAPSRFFPKGVRWLGEIANGKSVSLPWVVPKKIGKYVDYKLPLLTIQE